MFGAESRLLAAWIVQVWSIQFIDSWESMFQELHNNRQSMEDQLWAPGSRLVAFVLVILLPGMGGRTVGDISATLRCMQAKDKLSKPRKTTFQFADVISLTEKLMAAQLASR